MRFTDVHQENTCELVRELKRLTRRTGKDKNEWTRVHDILDELEGRCDTEKKWNGKTTASLPSQ